MPFLSVNMCLLNRQCKDLGWLCSASKTHFLHGSLGQVTSLQLYRTCSFQEPLDSSDTSMDKPPKLLQVRDLPSRSLTDWCTP